ncbi:hypothetical protein [Xanthobacter wiegelii]|uniref:hypothetical protein n=1 Tax=Xanthobacter wiegelii TaxID=3119913 RepID=UPI00372B90C9
MRIGTHHLVGVAVLLCSGMLGACASKPQTEWQPGEQRGTVIAAEFKRTPSAVSSDMRKAMRSCWIEPGGVLHGYSIRESANPAERSKFAVAAWDIMEGGGSKTVAELHVMSMPSGGEGYMVAVIQHGPEPALIDPLRAPVRKLEFGAAC